MVLGLRKYFGPNMLLLFIYFKGLQSLLVRQLKYLAYIVSIQVKSAIKKLFLF